MHFHGYFIYLFAGTRVHDVRSFLTGHPTLHNIKHPFGIQGKVLMQLMA